MKYILFLASVLGLSSCCSHNAIPPKEISGHREFVISPSRLDIPIVVSNQALATEIMKVAPNPLKEEHRTIKDVHVLNPVTVPVLTIDHVLVKKACDIAQQIKIKDGWKCIVCPPCCLTTVVVHTFCDAYEDVSRFVDKTIVQKVTVDLPLYYKVVLNDIEMDGNSNQLAVHAGLSYALKGDLDANIFKTVVASCGVNQPMPKVELLLLGNVDVTSDGHIHVSNKSWNIRWLDPCDLTALNLNLEDLVNLPFIKTWVESKVDDLLNGTPQDFDLAELAKPATAVLKKPIKLGSLGYLVANATELDATTPFVTKDNIITNLGAVCKPAFYLTDSVPNVVAPPLSISNRKIDSGFTVNILGSANLKDLNVTLKPLFEKLEEQVNEGLLLIRGIRLFESQNKLVVEVGLRQPFRGKVYFWGVPKFDTATNTIYLDSLTYTTESVVIIKQFADWLLHTDKLQGLIKKTFTYNFDHKLQEALKKFRTLNMEVVPHVRLVGDLNRVEPKDILVSDNKLNVCVSVTGSGMISLE